MASSRTTGIIVPFVLAAGIMIVGQPFDVEDFVTQLIALGFLWLIVALLYDVVPKAATPVAWLIFVAVFLNKGLTALDNLTAGLKRRQMKVVKGGASA